MANVYVVPCIDTEGPSDCSAKEQKSGIRNWGKAKTWNEIEENISKIISVPFRFAHTDSSGKPIKYSWSWLDWVGFKENPRQQILGYHAVYDHLKNIFGENMEKFGDGDMLHYHNPRPDGSWSGNERYPFEQWNREFNKEALDDILAHNLIDRNLFPISFRAGGTIEDNNLSAYLENYIPLDFSSRGGSYYPKDEDKRGALFDWRGTPGDWSEYHPRKEDYRHPGNMERLIFESLDHGKIHSLALLSKERIYQGFRRAAEGKDTVISYFSHDFVHELSTVFDEAHNWIKEASREFGVSWFYETPEDAARDLLGKYDVRSPKVKLYTKTGMITIDKEIFGIPFAALKNGNEYKTLKTEKSNGIYVIRNMPARGTVYLSVTDKDFANTIIQTIL